MNIASDMMKNVYVVYVVHTDVVVKLFNMTRCITDIVF